MLAQANPLAHIEPFAIGMPYNVPPGVVGLLEVREGAPRVGSPLFPIVGIVDNQADIGDIVLALEASNTVGGGYGAINIRVNGAAVATATIPPRGRIQFALETVAVAHRFVRLSYTGLGFGRVILYNALGRVIRRGI